MLYLVTPLLTLPVVIYNLYALTFGGGLYAQAAGARLASPLFTMTTAGGGTWPVSTSDLMLTLALIVMFVELIKASASRRMTVVNHALSILLFIVCLVELLIIPACATSTFFLLTLMVLLDVLAGLIATFASARPGADIRPSTTAQKD